MRIFKLCDLDKDGFLNNTELGYFQVTRIIYGDAHGTIDQVLQCTIVT
jgi:hypothetical protein